MIFFYKEGQQFSIDFNQFYPKYCRILDLPFICLIMFLTAVLVTGVEMKLSSDGLSRHNFFSLTGNFIY